jgi:hypothetical protein
MSGKYKWKSWKPPRVEPAQTNAGAAAAAIAREITDREAAEVRGLIGSGKHKPAVERAKEIHRRCGTDSSEALLADAYIARISSLIDRNLMLEAGSLLALVRERHASARDRLDDLALILDARQGNLDGMLGALSDPAISPERRAGIENAIKRHVRDPAALAECAALSPEHPLRLGAAAIVQALDAVTSGPVPDEMPPLTEVSRRGPLAPWKMLVRAIACFYRNEDEACKKYLAAVDPDSAPARLIPALRAVLSDGSSQALTPSASFLMNQVGASVEALRRALEALDQSLTKSNQQLIARDIRNAVTACQQGYPEILERLKQSIAVRGIRLNLPESQVVSAMQGPALKDACFWRMFARDLEESHVEGNFHQACGLWEQFRRHAVHQGWFRPDGPEVAALYLHMADLLRSLPENELARVRSYYSAGFKGLGEFYRDQPPDLRALALNKGADLYFLSPKQLYGRACQIDPHAEAFQEWLNWEKRSSLPGPAEKVAEAWHRALPNDSAPLLHLMESTEKRGALNRALGYIEKAERLDGLNPAVRRARLRLQVACAMRHLRQKKPRLAEQDLRQIESLPQTQQGDRPVFAAGMRWACSVIRGDHDEAAARRELVSRALGSEASARVVLSGIAQACGLKADLSDGAAVSQNGSLAVAVARACALGDDMALPFDIPKEWESKLIQEIAANDSALDATQLRALAEAGLRRENHKLAYAASAAGLARKGGTEGRFLLLRARALPAREEERRRLCLTAAVELARRQRDMDLVGEATDRVLSMDDRDLSMSSEQIAAVLEQEREAREYPVPPRRSSARKARLCDCAMCRYARGEYAVEEKDAPASFAEAMAALVDAFTAAGNPRQSRRKRSPRSYRSDEFF